MIDGVALWSEVKFDMKLLKNKSGSMIGGIVAITLGVVMLTNVFIATVKDVNTSGWSTSEVTLWALLSLVGIIGLVVGVLNVFGIY